MYIDEIYPICISILLFLNDPLFYTLVLKFLVYFIVRYTYICNYYIYYLYNTHPVSFSPFCFLMWETVYMYTEGTHRCHHRDTLECTILINRLYLLESVWKLEKIQNFAVKPLQPHLYSFPPIVNIFHEKYCTFVTIDELTMMCHNHPKCMWRSLLRLYILLDKFIMTSVYHHNII
jgi:hypothetical protein